MNEMRQAQVVEEITFKRAFERCVREKYVTFSGRASRSEYWKFTLIYVIILFVAQALDAGLFPNTIDDGGMGGGTITTIVTILLFLPAFTAQIRRLHDIGKSGWWILWEFLPLIGTLVLLYFLVKPSEKGANKYGPQPSETL
ncbi:DUF805 domain-containing protein [Negativicoccus succinicivorans]|uniref:DUF805 domain-containing protein n=1 Tax=Negativicoccus succinicivorans TaxID=620903 RepID=UPI002900ACC7|nr:DUF805 domain-containing protein [Negativicoccus succinicivorans]MDU2417283.1 DUF805 domain-containing protein [Negativicoccus succinicivorans]